MQVRLIALDLDGTTLCSDHLTLPEPNRIAIARAASQGVQVVIATGRIRGRIPQQLREIPGLRGDLKRRRSLRPCDRGNPLFQSSTAGSRSAGAAGDRAVWTLHRALLLRLLLR